MRIRLFLAFMCCFIFFTYVEAQNKIKSSKDIRLTANKPSVYITFEKQGKRKKLNTGDGDEGIWLRLHNNSIWEIGVCMFDVPKEFGDKEITYEVEKNKKLKNLSDVPVSKDPKSSCLLGLMKPGDSVSFSVPREHLSSGLSIKVNFLYIWDIDPDGFISGLEPKHFVYFYSSEIPKS